MYMKCLILLVQKIGCMINEKLLHPESIAVIGASNNTSKPGGKTIKNLIDNHYQGKLYAVNPKESKVQGIPSFASVEELPSVDLAILAIPAKLCLDAVRTLTEQNDTKAFIIISAGFGEMNEEGKRLEKAMAEIVTRNEGCLIGPNCIGVMTPFSYQCIYHTDSEAYKRWM